GPAARREPAEARDAREQASGAERAHHLAHLAEALDELAHLARAPAAAAGDARGATLVDDLGAGALRPRHRADQRLDAPELALVDLLGERADPRQPREDLAQRPHALDHAQLLQQILEAEAPAQEPRGVLLGLALVDDLLEVAHEADDVAHAED